MSEKVKVPKIFDDWIKIMFKNNLFTVSSVVDAISTINEVYGDHRAGYDDEFTEVEAYMANNYLTAIRAVIDGYEVEEPKRGFKLAENLYADVETRDFVNYGKFETETHFVALDQSQLRFAKKYLKGEVVTEDEPDE